MAIMITIYAISPFLKWLLSNKHIFDGYDVFLTSKVPNVSLEYVKIVYYLMLYILEMHFG